jgi:hypothetical protein
MDFIKISNHASKKKKERNRRSSKQQQVKQTIKTIEMDFLILTTYHTYGNQFVLEYCIVSKVIIIKD